MEKNLYTERQAVLLRLLRSTRREAGLRQEDLAERLEKHQYFVSRFESGERRLDILELLDVCQALGLTLSEFVQQLESELNHRAV